MPKKYQYVIFFKLLRTYPSDTLSISYPQIKSWLLKSIIDGFTTESDISITQIEILVSPIENQHPKEDH
jgi:hypothetical protein